MVNSGSFDSDGQEDRNAKTSCTQPHTASDSTQSSSPVTASAASSRKTGCSQTADSDAPLAIGPTPTKTEFNSDMPLKNIPQDDVDNSCASEEEKSSLCCSLPLEKVQVVLPTGLAPKPASEDDVATPLAKPTRKLLCLYCDRTFVSANLRQKHVERIHSAKKNRRVSSRKQSQLAVTQCAHCNRLNATENTLTDLFQHLVNEHSSKYFGCLPCEDRFLTSSLLFDHNATFHQSDVAPRKAPTKAALNDHPGEELAEQPVVKITRSRVRPKPDEPSTDVAARNKSAKLKELRCKKMSIKSSRIALKRRESKRLQALAKLPGSQKRRTKPAEKKQPGASKTEQINSTKSTEKTKSNLNCVNPYPEFDNFYRVKKITDHSIDNLKISSLTFDDVFDKAFFNRIKCNIEENLLHHIDGKLFKNEESETRISNFEKTSTMQQEIQNSSSDNYGCELSLNAVTPVPSLSLNSQFGEDFELQIEYGSKPSKKKNQIKKDEVHYKYFTRRKFQASILEQKENRDLSKLDMWTQLVIQNRQQKIVDDNKSAREILEYNTCNEYRSKLKREELNRILDRRGPFEDLREEASKKAALDKLNSASEDSISHESFSDVREVLDEILNRVFAMTRNDIVVTEAMDEKPSTSKKQDLREIPSYLHLQRSTSQHGDIDKSDKITLICSSQETENFELPTNQVRGKNELVELSGEWARSRMYICAACGAKLPNMKYLLEHKTLYHQNVWVQHYEFVGNQSELYRHLSIPALGKVGAVENSVQCKLWKRSEARACTKCGKQCNSLGELHRHVLECGGDWTWMLARKKCKYRPFGAKSRRKRRGLVQRIRHKQKTGPTEEKKKYKKTFNGPRQRPSDADTIQRMLANLPAKRSTRKLISLYDGVYRARKNNQMQQNVKQKKVKCGKMIYKSSNIKETTEKTINTARVTMPQKNSGSSRRSLRSLNRVLSSRILDTNSKLTVKRKIKVLNERRRTRQSLIVEEPIEINTESSSEHSKTLAEPSQSKKCKNDKTEVTENVIPVKRTSPRSTTKNIKKMSMKKLLTGNINIKSFFPVKKRENKKALTENQVFDAGSDSMENKSRNNKKLKGVSGENIDNIEVGDKPMPKKSKGDTFGKLVRSLSIRKKKIPKISPPVIPTESTEVEAQKKATAVGKALKEELDKTNKKRKLKRSFRNVINRVKRLKIDNAPEAVPESRAKDTTETNIKSTFLEERQPEKPNLPPQPVKIVVPSNLEAKENTADISETAHIVMNISETNESSVFPENIFKLESNNEKNLQAKGELNFDMQPDINLNSANINTKITKSDETHSDKMQPITIETSEKPKIVPLISPNMKGKIRKPARGLNDCIAMLTNKLQQKTTETIAKVGILNLLPSKCAPKMVEDPHPPKTECILRIPTFKTQGTIEETALDLTTKPKSSFLNPPLFGKLQISNPLQNLLLLDSSKTSKTITKFSSIDRTIEDVVENKSPKGSTDSINGDVIENKSRKESSLRSWNSVDEIIQTVVNGYELKGIQEKPRSTVDDIIDFVLAGTKCEDQQGFSSPDTLVDYSEHKITKHRSVGDLDMINPVYVEKSITANELGQKTADISTDKGDITRRRELISDTIDFVVAGGSIDVSASSKEVANVLIDESNSKPIRRIGSKRKQRKKYSKLASDDVEVPPRVEVDVEEKNICATSSEVQSRQDNVADSIEEQKSSIANNSGLNELDISRDALDSANNIPQPPDVIKYNIPLFRESPQNLDSLLADSLDTTLDKAFLQSPEVVPEQFIVTKVDKAVRKVGQARKFKFKQRKAVTVENKAHTVENKAVTVENKAVTVENKAVTVENKAVTVENKAVTVENKAVTVENKAATVESNSLTAIIETHLDDLLHIKEMNGQTEVSVSSFKVDGIVLSSEPQTKDLLLANEDEPRVFENKAVVQHNPSDSEDDIPLISLLKANETNSNENDINACDMGRTLRLDQIVPENGPCLLIEELSVKKRSVSVVKPSLCDQSKDSGIETDKSEESVSVDSEKTNLYLPDLSESIDNEICQKNTSIEEPTIDNSDSFASAVIPSSDIQKNVEYFVSDSVQKEESESLPNATHHSDISSTKFESPNLNIKTFSSKPRKSKSKKAVITEFKKINSCDSADLSDKLILSQKFMEKNSDSLINELEPLTNVVVDSSSTASIDIGGNKFNTTLRTSDKRESGAQNIISTLTSDEDIPKNSLVIIEGISNVGFQNFNDVTTKSIKNKKKSKSKPVWNKHHIFNKAIVDQNRDQLLPTVLMKNKSPGKIFQKKGRRHGKLSRVFENKKHERFSKTHDSEDEITDTLPLSVLASKDIPLVAGLLQGLSEKEENKPILEKEETHFSLENNSTAASVVSPGDIVKLARPSMIIKNRRKIGKRAKKKLTPKLVLPISKLMEISNENLLLLNPAPVISESLSVSETPEITSRINDNMEVNELVEIRTNEANENLETHTENLQLSGTAKTSRFNKRNLKQPVTLGAETSTGNLNLNNIETHTIKRVERTSRSSEKISDDGGIDNSDKLVLPLTILTNQVNVTVTDSIVPNDEKSNLFTKCVGGEEKVDTLENVNENEHKFTKLAEGLFEDKLNEAENTSDEIKLGPKHDIFLEPQNGNLLGLKAKKVIKKRSRSSKKTPTSDNSPKSEAITFGDEKISFIGEPVVDLVRCETQLLSTLSDTPFKDELVFDLDKSYPKSEESQLDKNSQSEQSQRSATWENTISTDSYSESFNAKASESEKSNWKSPESTIDSYLPKTPTKRRSRSLKSDPIVSPVSLSTSIELDGLQGSETIKTPVKRNSRSLNNDRKDPSSADSPLSDCRSSDRDLSESDVEFKIKTPPKRSPRSLRTRKTVPVIKTSLQNATKEKTSKEGSEYAESESITQVKKRARPLRNQLQSFSSDESSSATNEMKYLEMKDTELIESNSDSRLAKPRISRSLQNSFGVSSTDILNEFTETIKKGAEQTETIIKANLTKITLPSVNNSLVVSNKTDDGIDCISSGFSNLSKGKKRSKSLKNDFKSYFTSELDTNTTDLKDTEAEHSGERNIFSDLMKKTGDVLSLENKTNDNVHSLSNKNVEQIIQNEKEEINAEMIASDIMDTQVKPLTKTRLRSLKNNANSPSTNELPPIDLDENYEVNVLKNSEYPASSSEVPRTKNITRSTSFKENSTSSMDKINLNKTFDQNQPETEGVLSSSDIKILIPLDSEIKDWKIKRLNKKSRSLKSEESISIEACNKKIPEFENEEKHRVGVNPELNCQPSNLEFTSISTKKVKQRRSKSLKADKSTSSEVVEKQLNLDKSHEMKTKKLMKRSKSLKNVLTLPVSKNESFELNNPSEIKLLGNVEVILNPLFSESEVLVKTDPRADDKRNLKSVTETENEVTIIGTQLLNKTEQSVEDNIDNKLTNPAKKSSLVNVSELESSFDNINKMVDKLQVDRAITTTENPIKKSKLVKTRSKQIKISTSPLSDIKPVENIERIDLGVIKTNETMVTNETHSRSLRKKLAINYSEIEENNDTNNPSISNDKLLTNTVIVKDDTEPSVDVKKSKSKKSIILVSDDLLARNASITTDSSNIVVSTVGIDQTVDNMNLIDKNEEYSMKENVLDSASIHEKILFDGNITVNKTIEFESTVLSTNKQLKEPTKSKKSLRKKRAKSKSIVKILLKSPALENSIKDVDNSFTSTTELTSDLTMEPVNDVTLKELDIKEPPIKIIINTQKTRRKSKSIKKIGLKGQNDLFEDFALVIKKKRPIPMIAFTPPNTFTGETTYPCSLSKPAESLSDPAKDEDVIQTDLDVSVEEMDMEIDEIPITSNIIENSLSLALPVSPEEGPIPDAVPEKEKVIKINDTRKCNNKNKSIESLPMEDLEHTETLELPLEQDVLPEIPLVPVLSHEILENKTELISPKKGKRKTKTLRKKLLKAAAAEVNDPTENLVTANGVFSQLESITTIEKTFESIPSKTCESIPSKTCESVSSCSSFVLDEHVVNKTGPEETPFAEEPEYETTNNQVLEDPLNKERDIDRIYTFSETEDFEIEKPVELPRRLPRNKETRVTPIVDHNISEKKSISIEEPPAEHITKQKSKLFEGTALDQKQDTNVGEIKENDTEVEDNGRRKSMRSAKVKALEHIHDDALAELTESERNKESKAVKIIETETLASVENAPKKNSGKKQKKSQKPLPFIDSLSFPRGSLDGESPILADLVAELHGLEELENSIERELNAEVNEKSDEKETKVTDLPDASNVEIIQSDATDLEENQERRRSRRGSKKIASYNENDLINPLLDEIDGKRKPRKKDDKNLSSESKVPKKTLEPAKKLNSEELFDLLKASTTDNIYAPKQPNSFLNNLQDTARDLNHDNFDCTFEGVLEKSVILGLENSVKPKGEIEKIYEFTESLESSEHVDKLTTKRHSGPIKQTAVDDTISSISNSSFLLPTPDLQDSSMDSNVKVSKNDKLESCYCEICNKSFIRIENLIKHRRTLTHIQKLSEIEAREAEKSKLEEVTDLTETADDAPTELPSGAAGSIVEQSSTVQSSFSNSHTLKLADIINDVLNKPVLRDNEEHTFSDIVLQNSSELQPEVKRYKSLGERKSFDSDNNIPNDRTVSNPFASKTTILEKQISLLEGIIENQATNNYIDDISISSDSLSGRQSPSEMSSKLDDDTTRIDLNKPLMDDGSFIKPVQYEEISEDSANLRNYEDQKLRKTLNRDEELFLECCSLLKSGSEVSSSYSNKRMHNKVISTVGLRQIDEPEWLEKKSLVLQEPQFQIIDDSDDNSRIPTPLGDSYDDDASNSNTISSNWDVGDRALDAYPDKMKNCDRKFHFEDISKGKLQDQSSLKFEGLISNDRTDFSPDDLSNLSSTTRAEVSSNGSASDAKKIITKGARKVFEGLKVSIPTEELNLEKVLNCSPKPRKLNVSTGGHVESEKLSDSPTLPIKAPRKSKPVKKSQVGSNLLFKVNKKKVLSPTSRKVEENESKNFDVYDFEETQDNTDVFTKPDYRTFRTLKNGEPFNDFESETDSRDLDSFSLGPESITSSTSSQCSTKKPKAQENITKKKCMIMGRIFKNAAAKSKIEDIDEEIRDIPAMDNGELVENYVADCKKVIRNDAKPKLSEKEINLLFDQLLEKKASEKESANSSTTKTTTKSKPDPKKLENKKKAKVKGKKRLRTNSESTDDEFSLNKTIKKRSNRKNAKEEDNCINLEQELKECIGVASRKSQRKCTSGKQNVLVEYWSSDESQFEALLESQRMEAEPSEALLEPVVAELALVSDPPKELRVSQEFSKPKTIDKKPHKKKNTDRKKSKSRDASAVVDTAVSNRRKRAAANPLYHWSSSSEDESNDLIEVKPLRDELEDDEDRPMQHGWIVGESPKKLVMMLAQAKGKKTDIDCVKEQGKKRTSAIS